MGGTRGGPPGRGRLASGPKRSTCCAQCSLNRTHPPVSIPGRSGRRGTCRHGHTVSPALDPTATATASSSGSPRPRSPDSRFSSTAGPWLCSGKAPGHRHRSASGRRGRAAVGSLRGWLVPRAPSGHRGLLPSRRGRVRDQGALEGRGCSWASYERPSDSHTRRPCWGAASPSPGSPPTGAGRVTRERGRWPALCGVTAGLFLAPASGRQHWA